MAQTSDIVAIKTEAGADEHYIGDLNPVIIAGNESSKHVVLRVPHGVPVTIESIENTKTLTVAIVKNEAKQLSETDSIIEVVVYDLWRLVKEPRYKVKVSDKIFTLKYQIFEREGIAPSRQTLSIDGKDLNDLNSFSCCCIRNGDAINLFVKI